jgi:transmembrane sensor
MEMNDDLLISYLLGEVTADQSRVVENWRMENTAHEQRFMQFQLIWETSKNLDSKDTIDPQASLARLKKKIKDRKEKELGRIRLRLRYRFLRAVAAVFVIVGMAWFYTMTRPSKELQSKTEQMVKIDTLSDGSIITLNKHSILEYPSKFKGKLREVVLTKGEAFFNVHHDAEKPFLIRSGNTTIGVLGTTFNVKQVNGDVEVIVESGKVQVSRGGRKIFLERGEKVLVAENTKELKKEVTPDRLYNYYRTKEFVADDTPLWRMVQVLNEAYDSEIIIRSQAIKDLPLNATFKDESLDDILQVISRTFKLKIERKQHQIILK